MSRNRPQQMSIANQRFCLKDLHFSYAGVMNYVAVSDAVKRYNQTGDNRDAEILLHHLSVAARSLLSWGKWKHFSYDVREEMYMEMLGLLWQLIKRKKLVPGAGRGIERFVLGYLNLRMRDYFRELQDWVNRYHLDINEHKTLVDRYYHVNMNQDKFHEFLESVVMYNTVMWASRHMFRAWSRKQYKCMVYCLQFRIMSGVFPLTSYLMDRYKLPEGQARYCVDHVYYVTDLISRQFAAHRYWSSDGWKVDNPDVIVRIMSGEMPISKVQTLLVV